MAIVRVSANRQYCRWVAGLRIGNRLGKKIVYPDTAAHRSLGGVFLWTGTGKKTIGDVRLDILLGRRHHQLLGLGKIHANLLAVADNHLFLWCLIIPAHASGLENGHLTVTLPDLTAHLQGGNLLKLYRNASRFVISLLQTGGYRLRIRGFFPAASL